MITRIFVYFLAFVIFGGGIVAGIRYVLTPTAQAAVRTEPVQEIELVKILISAADLEVGAFLHIEDMTWKSTERQVVLSQHLLRGVISRDQLIGAVARRTIKKGDPLTAANLVKPGQRGFLAAVLRSGKRAVSVSINAVTGNAGLVNPGDHVDVILTQGERGRHRNGDGGDIGYQMLAETIMQNIRVIAMGRDVENLADADLETSERVSSTATLEVSPAQAEKVNVAARIGELSLSLRSLVADTVKTGDRDVALKPTWGADVSEAFRRPPRVAQAQKKKADELIVIRGSNSQTINSRADEKAQ
ncbi:MAG: Flp pilus assembly protein CpaB [Sneathiella sp.]|nr:Flp pilus assembly protein CpaB [Sneathiella sp.]